MSDKLRRPPGVTFACFLAGGVSVYGVFALLSLLSDWGSLEMQDAVAEALESDALSGVDISVSTAMDWLRIASVAMLCAALASTVLAIWAAKGDRSARWGLSVVGGVGSLLLALTDPAYLILGAMLLFAIAGLWTPEARIWFARVNGREPPVAAVQRMAQLEQFRREALAPPSNQPVPPPAPRPPWMPPEPPPRPPSELVRAAVIMLTTSVLVALVCAVNALAYLLREVSDEAYDAFFGDEVPIAETAFDLGTSERTIWVTFALSVAFTVLAMVGAAVAIALLMGRRWAVKPARILCYPAIMCSMIALPVGLVVVVGAAMTLILLGRPTVLGWMRRG